MREIKFRGKRIDNGEWVYGYLFKIWDKCYILWGTTNNVPNMIEVIPETIGQYTGLKDKNGKEIYENEIVEILAEKETWKDIVEEKLKLVVVFDKGEFLLKNQNSAFGPTFYHIRLCLKNLEIIGNITDNPELLEVQNEQ